MHLLITGGTGLIGSRLALMALAQGHRVRVLGLARNPAEAANRDAIARAGAEILLGEIGDADLLARAVQGIEVVHHLAAAQHEQGAPDQRFWDVNVGATRRLLHAAAAAGVRRLVHGSTIGVHGDRREVLDEAGPTTPDSIYGLTKLAAERLALARASALEIVIVRIGETYGPADRRLLKLFRALKRRRFWMIGEGANRHQPIFVEDLAQGLLRAGTLPRAAGRILLLPGPAALTTAAMVAEVAAAVGAPPPGRNLPLPPFLLAAKLAPPLCRPLGLAPPLHPRRLDFFKKSLAFNNSKTTSLLGFAPSTYFSVGAQKTAHWYRENSLL
jgi:nucleoside-diphosphate-sugar epimerase